MMTKAKFMAGLSCLACTAIFTLSTQIAAADDSTKELPVNGAMPPQQLRQLDGELKKLIKRWNIPGAAVAVCKDNKIIFDRGYGFADVEQSLPVLPDKSLFRIASISKTITAAATMKLAEERKLSLDDKACNLLGLPDTGAGARSDERLQRITVRDLLQMSAGWDKEHSGDPILQPYIFRAARRLHQSAPADFDTTMKYVFTRKLDFDPGSRFAYSNFEYGLLGKVIETVSGTDYEKFVEQAFFEPAGVKLYKAHTRAQDRLPDEVVYYAPLEKAARPLLPAETRRVPAPYGRAYMESDLPILGWLATAPQLATLMDKIATDDQLLNERSRQEMMRCPALPCWRDHYKYFALGWEVNCNDKSRITLYKDGTLPGTRAFVEHTSDGITWVTLFNGRPPQKQPDKFAHQVRELMTAALCGLQTKQIGQAGQAEQKSDAANPPPNASEGL